MIVLGFGGFARSGKTTACDVLMRTAFERGFTPKKMFFAERLKKALSRCGITKEENPVVFRETAQRWGASRRDPAYRPGVTGPSYWVDKFAKKMTALEDACMASQLDGGHETMVFVDDIRYPNEVDVLRKFPSALIFVDGASRLGVALTNNMYKHESEHMAARYTAGLLPDELFDFVTTNNSTEDRFKKHLNSVFDDFVEFARDRAKTSNMPD